MLQKHSKDIIFIVIILILIGIIWGVDKNFWLLIAINVVVIMVGLLYVNVSEDGSSTSPKSQSKENSYFTLKNIAEAEMDEILAEVDYDDFESVKKGKDILNKFSVGDDIDSVVSRIKKTCNYDMEVYYLGLTAICLANTSQLKEKDYAYISLGTNLIMSSNKLKTRVTEFLKNTKLQFK